MSRKVKVVINQEYEITLDVAENDDNLKIIDMLNFAYAELGKDLFAFEDSVYQNTKVIEIDDESVYIDNGIIGNSGSDIILDGKCSELNVPSELEANLESTMQLKLNCVRLSDEIEVIRFVNDEKICRENIINIQQIDLGEEGFSWVLWYMKMQKINKDEL